MSKVENGRLVPSFDVLDRLPRALGLDDTSAREGVTPGRRRGCP
ncbi:hypothetical protein [Streptomyces sp. NPDC001091]